MGRLRRKLLNQATGGELQAGCSVEVLARGTSKGLCLKEPWAEAGRQMRWLGGHLWGALLSGMRVLESWHT